jgi:hypothetical protein
MMLTIKYLLQFFTILIFLTIHISVVNAKDVKPYWGDTGHRVIGYIADKHLSKKARRMVKQILGNESLAMSSTWADFIKSDSILNAQTSAWHYVNIPDGQTYEQMQKSPQGDVIEATDRMIRDLKDPNLSIEKKRFALRFLVHLIGDLHQPLHTGRAEDLGGNRIRVRWFGRDSNLHRVWDSDLIDHLNLSYTELAEAINFPTQEQIRQWQSTDHRTWVEESRILAQKVYDSAKNNDNLGYRYAYDFDEDLKLKLLQGGVRLAGLLNKIFN